MLVRARVDGILHEQTRMPIELHSAVVSRIKIMAGMDVAERRRPQDGRISIMIRKSPLDVRVSTLPTVLGEKVVMRLLNDEALRPSPDQLGIRDQNLRTILDKITAPHGLIMISGPTGSGKTTTLYSCLSAADRAHRNVVTIEDPVEYRLRGVHQMQVSEKIGLTFANGLRTILRQDPDVIMVGECRDSETAHMAVQAALTGHVVFSTIHANDCISVLTRLLDMKADSFLVASALSLSISASRMRYPANIAGHGRGPRILRLCGQKAFLRKRWRGWD
jgi:type II secretory ATPase GspE/PulE/Tfp pilus assembly ATPase PilB-like protein